MACVAYLQKFPRKPEVVSLQDVQVLSLGDVGGGISFRKLPTDEASTTADSDTEGLPYMFPHSPAISAKDGGFKDADDFDINAWKVVCNRIFTCFSESDDEPIDMLASSSPFDKIC
mmetsp:Transcript_66052/g.104567  ORF Transcript_66052/g.104567 Transcript_66052/m.104567 type:complete len:116 (-) Transcript_66052:119-466(-)